MNVVVIGGGVVGAAIAYELSQVPNLTITLFEQAPAPAQASTGAALGVLMGAISQKPRGNNLRMRLFGIEQYNQWLPTLEAIAGSPIPFNPQGILRLCFADEDLDRWQRLLPVRAAQGVPLQWCDRDQLHTLYPYLNLDAVVAGIYAPSDRQINPTRLTQALLTAAAHQGVAIHFNSPVTALTVEQGRIQVATPMQVVQPDWVVIAAGVGSTALTTALARPVDIRPVLGQAVRVRVPAEVGLPDRHPVITGGDVHLVPLANGEYWIGATVEFPDPVGTPLPPDAAQLEQVLTAAIALCPVFQHATVVEQWFGLRPRPEGRPAPIIETLPDLPNVIVAAGHYRNGVLLAPATARQVRQAISPCGLEQS